MSIEAPPKPQKTRVRADGTNILLLANQQRVSPQDLQRVSQLSETMSEDERVILEQLLANETNVRMEKWMEAVRNNDPDAVQLNERLSTSYSIFEALKYPRTKKKYS